MKGAFVHGAYTDKVFFLLAAVCFVTAAGLNYGLDASLRRIVPGWFAQTFLGVPAPKDEAITSPRATAMPA